MRAFFTTIIIAAMSLGLAAQANATTYSASSAISDSLHGGSNDHAIWLPFFESIPGTPMFGDSNGSDFDFWPDGVLTVNSDGSATLSGRIVSQVDSDYGFDIVVEFSGLMGPGSGGPKKELKACAYGGGCGDIDPDTWDYARITEGTFTGVGDLAGVSFSVSERPLDNVYPLQIGEGANNKNGNLGASAWIYLALLDGCSHSLCDDLASFKTLKGDINIDLVETPLPAAFLLFGSGLAGLFGAGRRRNGS